MEEIPLVNMISGNNSTFGQRLRAERTRLGLTQPALAEIGGVSRETQINYEKDDRSPNCDYLARVLAQGLDVLYVLTGERASSRLTLDPMRRAVLDSFDRCSPDKQIEAVQYMALLAAGVAPGTTGVAATAGSTTKATVSKSILGVAVSSVGRRRKED